MEAVEPDKVLEDRRFPALEHSFPVPHVYLGSQLLPAGSWGGDGMCAGYYTGNVCMTLDFYNITDMDGISIYDGATGAYTDFPYTPDVELCIQTLPEAS